MLTRAIRKYGRDAFDHEVLEECSTLEAANEAEQWWIAHFGSDDLVLGYNLDAGGKSKNSNDSTRAKLVESTKNRFARMSDDERIEHMRRCNETARRLEAERGSAWLSARARRAVATLGKDGLAARGAKISRTKKAQFAAMSAEERSEKAPRKRGYKASEEAKKKMSDAAKARFAALSPEERALFAKRASDGARKMTPEQLAERGRRISAGLAAKRLAKQAPHDSGH